MKLVYEEAISVLPRLTGAHIAFLAFIHFTKHLSIINGTTSKLETYAQLVLPAIAPSFGLSTPNKEYLCSKGLMSINWVADANTILERYKNMINDFPPSIDDLKEHHPNINSIINQYGNDNVPICFLTATGKLIALSAMERAFGKLDMSIWIN
ncbi:hypothetical protein D9M71_555530 [compost metagenome]